MSAITAYEGWGGHTDFVRVLEGLCGNENKPFPSKQVASRLAEALEQPDRIMELAYNLRNHHLHMNSDDSLDKVVEMIGESNEEVMHETNRIAYWTDVAAGQMLVRFIKFGKSDARVASSSGLEEILTKDAKLLGPKLDVLTLVEEWEQEVQSHRGI